MRLAKPKNIRMTFFFNGGDETSQPDEDRCMVQSPMVATYDQQLEMNAEGVLAAALDSINTRQHDLIIVNFANPDSRAQGAYRQRSPRLRQSMTVSGRSNVGVGRGQMLLTADHGNCEVMWTIRLITAYRAHNESCAADPCQRQTLSTIVDGRLADLAPSLLEILGIAKPGE